VALAGVKRAVSYQLSAKKNWFYGHENHAERFLLKAES
jgi:hypothetical protein